MATLTITAPENLKELKKRFPHVNWNEIMKQGILKKLEELKKFEKLKSEGKI